MQSTTYRALRARSTTPLHYPLNSPFPRSLLNIGYANYPESLLNIMMMQGDSTSRESFMKNSFSSSEFAHKAFVANRIVHLRKAKRAN